MLTQIEQNRQRPDGPPRPQRAPLRIDATEVRAVASAGLGRRGRAKALLDDVSLTIAPGELVAIVGGSGAGKTTLLNTLAGVKAPSAGHVRYNGRDLYENLRQFRGTLGYVPQDDIVHTELTVERTLHYAALLRLPPGMSAEERQRRVADVMADLDIAGQARQRVGSLSGGQRKRTSIAVELLTEPGVFFLDEPTSGLDPATGREMLRLLRRLADAGSTVVLTTHAPGDIAMCDRVIVLARGGRLAFSGTPREALEYFEASGFEAVYERLATVTPGEWAAWFPRERADATAITAAPPASDDENVPEQRRSVGSLRQWAVLTRRAFDTLAHNPLTLAILAGSPLLVIAMMAVLFRPGAFDPAASSPSAAIMVTYWVAFGAFFFGLTYGLLMICTEIPIFHRERLVNVGIAPYVAAKATVLLPVLVGVVVLMLGVLRLFDRLPAGSLELYGPLAVTLVLEGAAAIAIGLLASAAVSRPEQATLALPLICFPQVLFSGAMLPVPVMADAGKLISRVMTDRWAFEALGRSLNLNGLFSDGGSPLGAPLLAQYGDSFTRPVAEAWLIMAASTAICLALTGWVLARKRPAF